MIRKATFGIVAFTFAVISSSATAAPCAGFTDVDSADGFCPHVEWVKNRSITLGCAPGLYCPEAPTTRLQMAAFLHRLGTALVPENIIWISDLQPIQPVIDQAKLVAHVLRPVLIRLAPGRYIESITLAQHVHLEGSGMDVTVLTSEACGAPGSPAPATVTIVPDSSVRNLTIENYGPAGAVHCGGIHMAGGAGGFFNNNVRNVAVNMYASAPQSAIRIAAGTLEVTLEHVKVRTSVGGPSTGILVDDGAGMWMAVRRSEIHVSGTGGSTGIKWGQGIGEVVDSVVRASSLLAVALDANAPWEGALRVRGGSLSSQTAVRAPAGPVATTFIAGTVVNGTFEGTVRCTYAVRESDFLPLGC